MRHSVGRKAAAACSPAAPNDGSSATPQVYMWTGLPGDFRPAPAMAVFTHWAAVAPGCCAPRAQFRPAPRRAGQRAYAEAIDEVRVARSEQLHTRTADQTQIARFWAAPIQNYWNEIAQTAAIAHHAGSWRTPACSPQLNLSLADATIAFYDAKYAYRFWRPITAIRGTTAVDIRAGRRWRPRRPTRAIRERTASSARAAAEVLSGAFGDRFGSR